MKGFSEDDLKRAIARLRKEGHKVAALADQPGWFSIAGPRLSSRKMSEDALVALQPWPTAVGTGKCTWAAKRRSKWRKAAPTPEQDHDSWITLGMDWHCFLLRAEKDPHWARLLWDRCASALLGVSEQLPVEIRIWAQRRLHAAVNDPDNAKKVLGLAIGRGGGKREKQLSWDVLWDVYRLTRPRGPKTIGEACREIAPKHMLSAEYLEERYKKARPQLRWWWDQGYRPEPSEGC